MAAVSQKWKDSVGKEIIEMGAYVFVWAIGVYCCIRLMRDYEFILKPLFLAAVFVSVLESGVEMCEAILVRSARRLWMLLLVIVIQPVRDLFSKVCGYYPAECLCEMRGGPPLPGEERLDRITKLQGPH
ncbi:unnamed protein product [Prorocentrum cordatum]|uniref:Uncharacterized protein n=1 Tax=Prorocentrum cordatum TaxID=2364126 RepID=A0ABN9T011_9DINO|nr:unnamed protein product [Polarella glacialis]